MSHPSPHDPQKRGPGRAFVRACGTLFAMSALYLMTDIGLRQLASNNADPSAWGAVDIGVYALGTLWSMLSWFLAALLIAAMLRERPRARSVAVVLVGLLCGLLFMSSFGYRIHYRQSPSWQVVRFIITEPDHASRLFMMSLAWWHVVGIGALSALTCAAFYFATHGVATSAPRGLFRLRVALPLGTAYLGISALTLLAPGFQEPLPVEANIAAAVAQCVVATTTHTMHLCAPLRPSIAAQPPRDRPNVLLVVHESLRADAVFEGLGYSTRLDARALSPFTSRLAHAPGVFVLEQARSNSTATESSVPTILSGVELGGATDAYGRAHTVWSLGKAAGAHTFLFSAQSYAWSHFDEYFFDNSLDVARTGRDLGPTFVNDVGVDDALPVDAALAHLAARPDRTTPFVGVIHFSGTHLPGYPGPGVEPDGDAAKRWMQSVTYIDKQVERLLTGLDQLGLSSSTVVISTSDHGEPLDSTRPVRRLGSYYEETVRIPVYVKLPAAWAAREPTWASSLAAWRSRNVQNIDLLATVRDLLMLAPEPSLSPPTIAGRSLVRAPEGDDLVSGQSTCAFRTWWQEGLYLVKGSTKVIISNERPTPEIYDLASDPTELYNLWGTEQGDAALAWARAHIEQGAERLAACKRAGKVCIVP